MDNSDDKALILADPVNNIARTESPMFTVMSWILTTDVSKLTVDEQIKFSAALKFLMNSAEDTRGKITKALKTRFEEGDLEGLILKESETGKSASIDIKGLRVQYMRPTLSDKVDSAKLEKMFEEKEIPADEAVKSVTIKIKGAKARSSMELVRKLKEKGGDVSVEYDADLLRTMATMDIITEEEAESLLKQSLSGSRVVCALTRKAAQAVDENIRMTTTVGMRNE